MLAQAVSPEGGVTRWDEKGWEWMLVGRYGLLRVCSLYPRHPCGPATAFLGQTEY